MEAYFLSLKHLSLPLTGSQEELLNQIVEAEKLLENICIQEKRKEDPKKSPELHAKCEEKLRNKQEEMEARIQKNLELIRKVRPRWLEFLLKEKGIESLFYSNGN